jgi:hypothetical protein
VDQIAALALKYVNMINFFRNTRRKLADNNQFLKYARYAVGEIVLVMIGILLALQVNNWNETQKERKFEIKMLSEINKELKSDIIHFKILSKKMHTLDFVSTKFIKMTHLKATFKDSLYKREESRRWYYLSTGILYQYNSGPYEALKASGLDKISSDSLRNSLIKYYDYSLQRNEAFIAQYTKNYDTDIAMLKSFLGPPYTEIENGEVNIYRKFPENIFLKPSFLDLLDKLRRRSRLIKGSLDRHILKMEKLQNQIKEAL